MPTSPPDAVHIHVHHPILDGEVVLRMSTDWDVDIPPTRVDGEAGCYEFEVPIDEPFVYFKVLQRHEGVDRWACGPDRLATTGAERIRDVFPAFEDTPARVTELVEVGSEHGAWSHRVFLPAGYGENALHRYPVLYMNDGHNLFRHGRGVERGRAKWSVGDTLARLNEMACIEQVLVVAVYPGDRMADYTKQGSEAYGRYLAEVLKPHIDSQYLTLTDPHHTAVMGSSLGGVSAFHCAWSHPETFGMAGCMSSSFGYDDDLKARVLAEPKRDIRVYLDSGWPRDNFEVTRDMRARLVRAGFQEGVDLLYFAYPGDRHSEVDWGDRSHVPFQFFFGHRPDTRSHAGRHAVESSGEG